MRNPGPAGQCRGAIFSTRIELVCLGIHGRDKTVKTLGSQHGCEFRPVQRQQADGPIEVDVENPPSFFGRPDQVVDGDRILVGV